MDEGFGFGDRLKAARVAKGLSQSALGEGAGENGKDASKQAVAGWEKDRHYPKADQLRVICQRLGVSADSLLFGDIKPASVKVQLAAEVMKELTEEERLQLFAVMTGPSYDDQQVESLAPITASLKKHPAKN